MGGYPPRTGKKVVFDSFPKNANFEPIIRGLKNYIFIHIYKIQLLHSNEHQKGLLLMIAIEIEIVRIFVTPFTGFLQPSQ